MATVGGGTVMGPLSVMVGLVERPAMAELTNPNLIGLESELCMVPKKVQENLEKFFNSPFKFFILFFVVIFYLKKLLMWLF